MRPALVILFAKPPCIGLSKTRLAAGLGQAEARRIAGFTLARTLRAVRGSGLELRVYTAPDRMVRLREGQAPFGRAALYPQGTGGLTERLGRALREAPNGPVIFIGADAPDISARLLCDACRALRRHDAVFGPAEDGGFWLFGLNKGLGTCAPFEGVRWSGPHAMADVAARLPEGTRIAYLKRLRDIDEVADWAAWRRARADSHRNPPQGS